MMHLVTIWTMKSARIGETMAGIPENDPDPQSSQLDPLLFGRRVRHVRKQRGLTLRALGAKTGKAVSYLSQVETGKREPNLSMVNALASALNVTAAELLTPAPPSRRAELEIAVERAQRDPLWREQLGLPRISPSAGVPTPALEAMVGLFEELRYRRQLRAATPEGARRANAELREHMRARNNYFPEIEVEAAAALDAIGFQGSGPLSWRSIEELARHLSFAIEPVRDLPSSVRSVADLRNRRIYVPQTKQSGGQATRWVVVQTLGHFVLGHGDPEDFGGFLRQRVEANYFAGAVLVPERAAVPFLLEAKQQRDLAVEDVEQRFAVSYEMAAHRFTNLATRHLDIRVHFLRADEEGLIGKAYENDGIPFPADPDGGIEGQLVCRYWGARQALRSERSLSVHSQYTDTAAGTYWDATLVEEGRQPGFVITVGTGFDDARYFRGSQTPNRATSECPTGACCRRPSPDAAGRWDGFAWPSPSPHSHVLATLPSGMFPGVDLSEVYEFLDRRS
jgi:XRE family transcriptional regulator, fatty acid utilization regulator